MADNSRLFQQKYRIGRGCSTPDHRVQPPIIGIITANTNRRQTNFGNFAASQTHLRISRTGIGKTVIRVGDARALSRRIIVRLIITYDLNRRIYCLASCIIRVDGGFGCGGIFDQAYWLIRIHALCQSR